jgi:hypothetical protein
MGLNARSGLSGRRVAAAALDEEDHVDGTVPDMPGRNGNCALFSPVGFSVTGAAGQGRYRSGALVLDNRRTGRRGQADGGDGGQEGVLGNGGENLVRDAEHYPQREREATGHGGQRPPAGQQRAARPGDQQADQDQAGTAGGVRPPRRNTR